VRLVVTGGAGFIGSNFVRYMLARYDDLEVVNLDKLTYAGNLANLRDVEDDPRYTFVRGDICDAAVVGETLRGAGAVVNFAAETHVDRSISGPQDFIRTDVLGTHTLLEAVRELEVPRYLQISTDEVYGSTETGAFTEESDLDPSSPYSASKAGGDLQVLAWHHTYGIDAVITRGSNTFGPRQYPEKLIPLFVTNALDAEALPVYGDGMQIRDWIYVTDHCEGIWTALERGVAGEVYNVGGGNEVPNIEITHRVLALTGADASLIRYVTDRPGHDRRYSIATQKLRELGWAPKVEFEAALTATVAWYRDQRAWWEPIKSGEYRAYYETQYGSR